jgi:hypothetical protein
MHINSQYPGTDLFFDHTDWRDAIARMSDYASRRFSDQDSYYRDLNQRYVRVFVSFIANHLYIK